MSRKDRKPSSPSPSPSPPPPQGSASPRTVPPRPPGSWTLDELRHAFAWDQVRKESRSFHTQIDQEVQGLPVALRTQGLGVAVATLLSRDKPESRWLANALATWLLEVGPQRALASERGEGSPGHRLLEAVVQARDPLAAAAALREAIAVVSAIKRISGALVKGGGAGHGG